MMTICEGDHYDDVKDNGDHDGDGNHDSDDDDEDDHTDGKRTVTRWMVVMVVRIRMEMIIR